MEHNYLQEFMETCHAKERKWFLEQTFQYLNEHRQELADHVKKNLEIFLRGVVIGQNEFPVPVECIQISLLDQKIQKLNALKESLKSTKKLLNKEEIPWDKIIELTFNT